jgi:hypothetical protein
MKLIAIRASYGARMQDIILCAEQNATFPVGEIVIDLRV